MRKSGTYDTIGGAPRSPKDQGYEPTQLEEDILCILENAGVPESINDQIFALIMGWERTQSSPEIEDTFGPSWVRGQVEMSERGFGRKS